VGVGFVVTVAYVENSKRGRPRVGTSLSSVE